jgi:DNA-binding transcriptional LysR family regulator
MMGLQKGETMWPTFDMNALRTMVVGIELGSFARAASQLGRSQSAISMHLKKLEEQTGQPLFRRNGRGLIPTEAGDTLLAYARQIIALNDEAAASLGTAIATASVRMALPQDLFEDVMPEVITRFFRLRPGVHVEVRADRDHTLQEDVCARRLDVAIAFFPAGSDTHGTLLGSAPMLWLGAEGLAKTSADDPVPLVALDHPCLFRQAALRALEGEGRRWRLALTTPSLSGVWAALRSGFGVSVRPSHPIPSGLRDVNSVFGLPELPAVELRMLVASELPPAASDLRDIVNEVICRQRIVEKAKAHR